MNGLETTKVYNDRLAREDKARRTAEALRNLVDAVERVNDWTYQSVDSFKEVILNLSIATDAAKALVSPKVNDLWPGDPGFVEPEIKDRDLLELGASLGLPMAVEEPIKADTYEPAGTPDVIELGRRVHEAIEKSEKRIQSEEYTYGFSVEALAAIRWDNPIGSNRRKK